MSLWVLDIQLRVHYELNLRRNPEKSAIYILSTGDMLPDISTKANNVRFKIAELFPNFVDKETISRQSLDILSKLYNKHIQGIVTAQRLKDLIADLTSSCVAEPVKDFGEAIVNLKILITRTGRMSPQFAESANCLSR